MSNDALEKLRSILLDRQNKRAALDLEISELETTEKVLLRYFPDRNGHEPSGIDQSGSTLTSFPKADTVSTSIAGGDSPPKILGPLSGKSIKEAARHVLSEPGRDWTSYQDIAKRAFELGYRSLRSGGGNDSEKVAPSFYIMLRRYNSDFEQDKKLFRILRAKSGAGSGAHPGYKTKVESVEAALKRIGPAKIIDIVRSMEADGYKFDWDINSRRTYNAMTSTLRDSRFRNLGDGLWTLVGVHTERAEPNTTHQ